MGRQVVAVSRREWLCVGAVGIVTPGFLAVPSSMAFDQVLALAAISAIPSFLFFSNAF